MSRISVKEIPVVFDCLGDHLIGIVHQPQAPVEVGVLAVVAGGPQYRAGVGRGMVSLARELAGQGVAVMRFDYRGLGDSSGDFLGYCHIAEDLKAAVEAFRKQVPNVTRIVIWGGCDAASAAMIHGWKIAGVDSLILGNPWVSNDEIRSAVLRKHYLKRLGEAEFWRKLTRFEYNLVEYAGAGLRKGAARIINALGPGKVSDASDNIGVADNPTDRMLAGLTRFEGPVLFLMSGKSLVSDEFDELISGDPAWQAVYSRPTCKRIDLPNADQTFSDSDSRERVNKTILDWVIALDRRQVS